MRTMSKKKPTPAPEPVKRGPGRPAGRTKVPLPLRIDPRLKAALETLAEMNRRKVTTEVELALEDRLRAAGLWPPSSEDGQNEDS